MKPKYILIILTVVTIITVFYSCKDNPVNPPPVKSPRDYTWIIDTLNIPDAFQNLMRSMYAANAEDIYLIGHNSGSQIYSGNGQMWHYNGKKWSVVDLRKYVTCAGFLYGIHGTSSNNIWAVGEDCKNYKYKYRIPLILQYNGVTWKKHLIKQKNGLYGPLSHNEIYSVFVESETNVWACGAGGLVYHYDGNNWDIDTLNIPLAKNKERFELVKIVGNKNNKYILSNYSESWDATTRYYIFHYKNDQWAVIDSFAERPYYHPFGVTDLYYSSFGELYSVGPEVYKRENNWETITLDHYTWIWGISDYGKDNMIAVGTYRAFHYNGSDWAEIKALTDENISYQCVWMDSKNVFVVGNTTIDNTGKTIVWHGK